MNGDQLRHQEQDVRFMLTARTQPHDRLPRNALPLRRWFREEICEDGPGRGAWPVVGINLLTRQYEVVAPLEVQVAIGDAAILLP